MDSDKSRRGRSWSRSWSTVCIRIRNRIPDKSNPSTKAKAFHAHQMRWHWTIARNVVVHLTSAQIVVLPVLEPQFCSKRKLYHRHWLSQNRSAFGLAEKLLPTTFDGNWQSCLSVWLLRRLSFAVCCCGLNEADDIHRTSSALCHINIHIHFQFPLRRHSPNMRRQVLAKCYPD